jgi:hypothetical protein
VTASSNSCCLVGGITQLVSLKVIAFTNNHRANRSAAFAVNAELTVARSVACAH